MQLDSCVTCFFTCRRCSSWLSSTGESTRRNLAVEQSSDRSSWGPGAKPPQRRARRRAGRVVEELLDGHRETAIMHSGLEDYSTGRRRSG